MARITAFILLSIIFSILYCLGLLMFLTDNGEDKCEMTYMFEYPQFVRVSHGMDKKYSKYGLYAYSEGKFTSRARDMKFDGIPVLFIPGNAGSYRQVRSLSSVALRKAISDSTPFHFDYFTLDLNQELSGLYGPLLYNQLEYVNASFYKIFELYSGRYKPNSIVLVGHSMGGIIAKHLLNLLPDSNVSIVITLATPLKRPALISDYHQHRFYAGTHKDMSSTILVSLAGGYRDFLIPPFLSRVKGNTSIYATTSSVPRSWVECNHVQILWCKQIILALSRALFDCVDLKTYQITTNTSYCKTVFHHHLIENSGIKIRNMDSYSEKFDFNYKGKWIENIQKQYSVQHLSGLSETHWYMVKLNILPGYEILNILAINLNTVDWVYLCNANKLVGPSKVCTSAYRLTHLSEIIPSSQYKRRYFQTNLHELRRNHSDLTHVVFRGLPSRQPVVFHVDIHGTSERDITVDLPRWWIPQSQTIIDKTLENAIHYKLILPKLYHIIQYYHLFLEPVQCTSDKYHASAVLVSPWSDDKSQAYFTDSQKQPLIIRLFSSKSPQDIQHPYIVLTLDPNCTFRISIKPSFLGTLGQIARTYTPFLLAYIAVVVLMALRTQLQQFKTGNFPILFSALSNSVKPYYVLTLTRILVLVTKGKLPKWFPVPDNLFLIDDGIDFLILPLLLYMCSVGIVLILTIIYFVSLFMFESTVNKLMLKILNRTFVWSNPLINCFHKMPAIVAVLLIFLSTTTCGSLALCLGAVFYFMRLTQMSQDYIEDVMWFVVKKCAGKLKKFFNKKSKPKAEDASKLLENTDLSSCDTLENKTPETSDEIPVNDVPSVGISEPECDTQASEDDDCDKTDQNAVTNVDAELNGNKAVEVPDKPEEPPNESLLSNFSPIFFHTTMFFLWCIIAIINVPAVLTWAHNFKYSKTLTPDTSFVPGLILSSCALPLWQFDFPRRDRKWLENLEIVIFIIGILSLMFATVSIYRLNYLLIFVFVLVVLQQLFAPKIDNGDGSDQDNDSNKTAKDKYEDIKAKLD